MNIYLNKNVYEAAKDRIRFVYREFKNVVVNFSGGKDSTVVLHLALEVAEETGRLPVNVDSGVLEDLSETDRGGRSL